MAPTRKHESGSSKRKRIKERDKFSQSQSGAMDKFIFKKGKDVDADVDVDVDVDVSVDVGVEENVEQPMEKPFEEDVDVGLEENVEHPIEEPFEEDVDVNVEETMELGLEGNDDIPNIFDPKNWDNLAPKWRDLLVKEGPLRDVLTGKGPKDRSKTKKRRFTSEFYTMYLSNGEKHHRDWLVYCKDLDRDQIKSETEHWRKVLQRLFAVVKYLAKQSLAFRGTNEKIYDESNGNFMALVKMVAEWDSTLKEHLRRKQNHEMQFHYLSHKIQNELILLIAAEIKGAVLKRIKEAKYFSVILDCTPDISKQEQMTLIIRCVDVSTVPIQVQEYFLQFLVVNDTTGEGLFEELKNVLHHLGLDIDDVRGQGYDNGSNMKGKHKGVQRKLLDINPRAFYTPCAAHSLNLTLSDVANSCQKAEEFFGVVQRIYTLFADSTKRWDILKDNVSEKGYTLKSLSTTRWESRVDSVKAIVTQAPEIREALHQLAEKATDSGIKSEAKCLADYELGKFEFIVGMVIWYHILAKVNIVSKQLQSENMRIDVAMGSVKALIAFFKEYREEGFEKALNCAKEIADELDIDPVFPEKKKKRKIHKKRHFDEIDTETQPSEPLIEESSQESFRVHYFVYIIDEAIGSLEKRFEQYEQYEETFGFLFTAEKLKSLDAVKLKKSCNNLEKKLENGHTSDINGEDLLNELGLLQKHLPNELDSASAILNFLKRANCYPTSCLAYRIMLTVPVTVASAERSFSKLKILKSYLRSTMSQGRLNALALISIEHEFLEKLDYDRLIDDFASKSARRSMFRK
ncbi:unnamed protein product [Rhodiola kirilowii]